MNDNARAGAATPHGELIDELLDSRIAKSEREWAAAREIERLRELSEWQDISSAPTSSIMQPLGPTLRLGWMEDGKIVHEADGYHEGSCWHTFQRHCASAPVGTQPTHWRTPPHTGGGSE